MSSEIFVGRAIKAYKELENVLLPISSNDLTHPGSADCGMTLTELITESEDVQPFSVFKESILNPSLKTIKTLKLTTLTGKGGERLFSGSKKKIKEIGKGRGSIDLGIDLVEIALLMFMYKMTIKPKGFNVRKDIKMLDKLGEQIVELGKQRMEQEDNVSQRERKAWSNTSKFFNKIRDQICFIYRKDLKT